MITLKVDTILADRKINTMEFSRMASIAYGTAIDLRKGVKRIDLETLNRVCASLDLTPGDLLEYTPDVPKEESTGKARGKKKG